jgi:transposase
VTARADLTDQQWQVLEPLLPKASGRGRPVKWPRRRLIDGIRWRIRVGAPWRDVPARYGSWSSMYDLFRRWQRDGVWLALLVALQAHADAVGLIVWQVSVDSTVARVISTPPAPAPTATGRPNHPVGCSPSRPTTRSAVRTAG